MAVRPIVHGPRPISAWPRPISAWQLFLHERKLFASRTDSSHIMGRARRQIHSGQVYEICMRTRQGLPFVCTNYMKMLIEGIMARVQRDHKVILCHHLWMGNHPHMIVVAKDKKACTCFYGEVQKQLTEAVKRLLGLKHLTLWKNNCTSVIPYYDLETVCFRIAYLYANPASANLVDSISQYPGVSTWRGFRDSTGSLEDTIVKQCPWVRAPMIEKLSRPAVSRDEDLRICRAWKKDATESHELIFYPNAWMKSFGLVKKEEFEEAIETIHRFHLALEEEARKRRKRRAMGKAKLRSQPLDLSYYPKKPSRRIFVYSLDPALRAYLIEAYRNFCDRCRECYECWKLGDFSVKWPSGALYPPVPNLVNEFPPQLEFV